MNDSDLSMKLDQSRWWLIQQQVFYGSLAMALPDVLGNPHGKTACTDGRRIFWDRAFLGKLTDEETRFVLMHETLHCFPAGTMIGGMDKPIEQIKNGDTLIGLNGKPSRVVGLGQRTYDGAIHTIKARGMLPVEVTSEHPFLTVHASAWKHRAGSTNACGRTMARSFSKPNWKNADQLKVGDWLLVPKIKGHIRRDKLRFKFGNAWSVPKQMKEGVKLTEDVAEFIGWYVAEGYTHINEKEGSSQVGFSLAAHEINVARRLKQIAKDAFGYSGWIHKHGANGLSFRFSSCPLGRFLREHCGVGAHEKRIPDFILYHRSDLILRAFLRGYIQGDGCVGRQIAFCSASRVLAMQIQLAFARLGSLINLFTRKPVKGTIAGRGFQSGLLFVGSTPNKFAYEALGMRSPVGRPTHHFADVGDYLATPITSIESRQWIGDVFNFETSDHAYTAGNILTHNCAHSHLWRFPRPDKRTNQACDHAINLTLAKIQGIKMPVGGLADPAYENLAEEEIYNRLPQDPPPNGGKGQGQGQDGTESGGNDPCGDFTDPAENDSGQKPGDKPGKPGQEPSDGSNGGKSDGKGPGKADSLREEWEERVIQAAQAAKASGRGNIPADMQRVLDRTLSQNIDWRIEMADFVRDAVSSRNDWSRSTRRMATAPVIYPRRQRNDLGLVIFARDVSGSISNALASEFTGLIESALGDTGCRGLVLDCDCTIQGEHWVSPGEEVPRNICGGGGTSFIPIKHRSEELIDAGNQIAGLVILTDGDGDEPEAMDFPVLWLSTSDKVMATGRTIKIDG